MSRKLSTKALTLSLVVGIASASALAHGGATGVVRERMDAMGVIGQMLHGTTDYHRAGIEVAAGVIASHAGKNLTQLFPKDSINGPSETLPAIGSDWATFQKQATVWKHWHSSWRRQLVRTRRRSAGSSETLRAPARPATNGSA